MRGVRFVNIGKIEIIDDLEKPKIQPHEVLIQPKFCGICGSGIESYRYGGMYIPGVIIGHEFSGDVVELGKNVKKLKIGDRVTVNPNVHCGDCYWCNRNQENMCKLNNNAIGTTQNGGMAEFVNVRADRVYKIPDDMSYEAAATVEPLSDCVYAIQESGFKIGDNATIIGAGTMGLMTIQALKTAGVNQLFVLEPVEFKQKKALELGATQVLLPKYWNDINRATDKIGPDHIFDCVGNPETIMTSLSLIKKGGNINLIGVYPAAFEMKGWMQVTLKNINIRGIYGCTPEVFKISLKLIAEKKVDGEAIITKKIPMEEVPKMFKILANPPHKEIKVLVKIN